MKWLKLSETVENHLYTTRKGDVVECGSQRPCNETGLVVFLWDAYGNRTAETRDFHLRKATPSEQIWFWKTKAEEASDDEHI